MYVKKVNGSNDNVIDLTTETVLYKINLDPAFNFTSANIVKDFANIKGQFFSTTIFSLMTKDMVDEMVNLAGSGFKIITAQDSSRAELRIGTTPDIYWNGGTCIVFSSSKMGEITIVSSSPTVASSRLDRAACNRMMNYLATERTGYSDLSFEIKVQS